VQGHARSFSGCGLFCHLNASRVAYFMKKAFLRFERTATTAAMLTACAMLALAAFLGMFQIFMRFVLESPPNGPKS
jgi:hypothetical protein